GRTTLHYSTIKGNLTANILHFLCDEIRLSTGLRDSHRKTPLDYAVKIGKKDHNPNLFNPD
ncbi:uncharacterized protein NECHADRAFT_56114, partial [Fusarium vanettenii 77-13-4]